eukprot:15355177-Ditylum_brightwellii.AAC.1
MNYICHTIYKQVVNPLCCMCGKFNKTILHIASGCDMLQGAKYMERHVKRVNHAIAANCPSIVLLDETKRTSLLIDVSCPMDVNMVIAATEKHKKYQDIEIAMKKQYKITRFKLYQL